MNNSLRPVVLSACRRAMRCDEHSTLSYEDALQAAESVFRNGWRASRNKRGVLTPADEERLTNFAVPSAVARRIFDTDVEVQCILCARDTRLPQYHESLIKLIATHKRRELAVRAFLNDFEKGEWKGWVDNTLVSFPSRAMFALVTAALNS